MAAQSDAREGGLGDRDAADSHRRSRLVSPELAALRLARGGRRRRCDAPLLNRHPTMQPGISECLVVAVPIAAAAVFLVCRAWVLLVCVFPSLDHPLGFAITAFGCVVAVTFALVILTLLLMIPLSIFATYPLVAMLYAYPGIVLGAVLPRIVVPTLRPSRLRAACAIRGTLAIEEGQA